MANPPTKNSHKMIYNVLHNPSDKPTHEGKLSFASNCSQNNDDYNNEKNK